MRYGRLLVSVRYVSKVALIQTTNFYILVNLFYIKGKAISNITWLNQKPKPLNLKSSFVLVFDSCTCESTSSADNLDV